MSALIFGKYGSVDHIEYLGMKEDQSAFFARSEAFRIKEQFKNRARRWPMSLMLAYGLWVRAILRAALESAPSSAP